MLSDPVSTEAEPRALEDSTSPMRLLILALALLALYQILTVVLWNGRPGVWLLGLAAAPVLGIVLPLVAILRRLDLPLRTEVGLGALSLRQIAGTLLCLAGILPIAYAMSALNARFVPPIPEYWEFFRSLIPTDSVSFVCGLLAVVVFVPLGEEVLFRRLVFGVLLRNLPLWVAVTLCGLVFGAAHLEPWVVLPITLLGALLAWLTYCTGSITAAWIGHALFNLFAYLELAVTGNPKSTPFESFSLKPLTLALAVVVLSLGIGIIGRPAPLQGPRE